MEFDANDYRITDKRGMNPIPLKENGKKLLAFSKNCLVLIVASDNILNTGKRKAWLTIHLLVKNLIVDVGFLNSCEEFDKINVDEILENLLAFNYLYSSKLIRFKMPRVVYKSKLKELENNIKALLKCKEPARKPVEILGEELYNNALTLSKAYAKKYQEKAWEYYDKKPVPDDRLIK